LAIHLPSSTGREGLERLAEAIPDLIISDVMMPDLDGFQMLSHLRSDPATRLIPAVTLTAKGTTEDIVTGLGLGLMITSPSLST
jgi:CheY-like chemotaxis protein